MSDCKVLARWVSQGGAHWVEADQDIDTGFCGYVANGTGGSLGTKGIDGVNVVRRDDSPLCWVAPERRAAEAALAVAECQAMVDAGRFLPDNAKRAMRRVI